MILGFLNILVLGSLGRTEASLDKPLPMADELVKLLFAFVKDMVKFCLKTVQKTEIFSEPPCTIFILQSQELS